MQTSQFIDCIYTHTEGEPTCIIHGAVTYPAGLDIIGKREFLKENYDYIRLALMREPRGHKDMFGVFVTPPSEPDADAGMLWMDGERWVEMCGHGTIALSMALVSHRLIHKIESPVTTIRYETPAGRVTAEVGVENGKALWTRMQNVPALVLERGIPVELPGYGQTTADLSFGGNIFAVVEWPFFADRPIAPENAHFLQEMGELVKKQINAKMKISHPTLPGYDKLHFATFWQKPTRPDSLYRNVHVFSDGKLDRSPGGTGTCAMMAYFEARGAMKVGEVIRSEGLLGSGQFEGKLIGETTVGGRRAVIPTVKGTAAVVGYAKWLVDLEDPVGRGFVVG